MPYSKIFLWVCQRQVRENSKYGYVRTYVPGVAVVVYVVWYKQFSVLLK